METAMWALLTWIVANSTYAMPQSLPKIEYHAQIELRRMVYCAGLAECDDAKLPGILLAAVYEHENQTMYLPEGFDFKNPQNKATLVHELTHHLQALAGKFASGACAGPSEHEAYEMEDKWLASQGLPVPARTFAQLMTEMCDPGPT